MTIDIAVGSPPQTLSCRHDARSLSLWELESAMRTQQDESAVPNWDDEHGIPTTDADWRAALALAARVEREMPCLAAPRSSPCGDGSVHLTWYRDGTRITIDRCGARAFYSVATSNDDYLSGASDSDDQVIDLLKKYLG